MRKSITTLVLTCLWAGTVCAQYQLENAGFEQWDSVSYYANKTTRAGQEPIAWNSFITGSGTMKSFAGYEQLFQSEETRPGSEGSYSALLTARSVLGVIAQGNMTTGCVNMGSITAADADGNYNYTAVDSAGFNQPFTGMPDSLRIWVKFYGTNTSYPYAKVNTLLHTEGYYQDPMGNYESITATLVAKAENVEIETNDFEWQEIVIPFEYADSTDERPAYALVSISTNATPGKGNKADSMYVDDLEYIYNSELLSLSYDSLDIFQEGVTGYDLSDIAYEEGKLEAVGNGHAAVVTTVYNDTTGIVTVTVEGDDISENPDNMHVYTIQFTVPFDFTGSEPADGDTLDNLYNVNDDHMVRVYANNATPDYVCYDLIDAVTGDTILASALMSLSADSTCYEAEVESEDLYTLMDGTSYTLTFSAYEDSLTLMATYAVTIYGSTVPFSFSDVQWLSISPDDGSYLASSEDNTFTLSFDGAVVITSASIDGVTDQTSAFESITANEDSTAWALVVGDSIMTGSTELTLSVAVTDTEGKVVEGNTGEEEDSYFVFSYYLAFNRPDFTTDPADSAVVTSLSTITVSYEEGISVSGNATDDITVSDAEGNIISTVDADDIAQVISGELIITLAEPITEAGNYTICFPIDYFSLGDESDTQLSKETVITIIVDPSTGITAPTVSTNATDTHNVYTLGGILVRKNADANQLKTLPKGIYIIDGKKTTVK